MSSWLPAVWFPMSGLHVSIIHNHTSYQLSVTYLEGRKHCCLRRRIRWPREYFLSFLQLKLHKHLSKQLTLLLFSDACYWSYAVCCAVKVELHKKKKKIFGGRSLSDSCWSVVGVLLSIIMLFLKQNPVVFPISFSMHFRSHLTELFKCCLSLWSCVIDTFTSCN